MLLCALYDRLRQSFIGTIDHQYTGKLQLIHLFRKEHDGLKAGFGLRGTAGKSGVIVQAVVIRQIAEGETIAK